MIEALKKAKGGGWTWRSYGSDYRFTSEGIEELMQDGWAKVADIELKGTASAVKKQIAAWEDTRWK